MYYKMNSALHTFCARMNNKTWNKFGQNSQSLRSGITSKAKKLPSVRGLLGARSLIID